MVPNAISQIPNSSAPINFQYASLLLSAVLGVSMAYIAWQQCKINKYKVRVDLFDRRLRIYQEVMKFWARVMQNGTTTNDELVQLLRDTKESEFLFGHKVAEFINSIYKRGVDLDTDTKILNGAGPLSPKEKQRLLDAQCSHFEWLRNQSETAKEIFKKYLDISKLS